MRELDRIPRDPAKGMTPRFHRGRLGEVLQRFLDDQNTGPQQDYNLLQLEQLWRAAAALEPAIGLKLFERFTPQDWHVIAHASLYCPDVAASMAFWVRYAPLGSDTDRVQLVTDTRGAGVEVDIDTSAQLGRYLIEHYGVMSITQLRRGTGLAVQPVLACFSHPCPAYHAQYHHWFGERIEFDCPANRFYFDPQTLQLPLQTRHAGMLELLSEELDRRVALHRRQSGWAAKVAAACRQALAAGHSPTLESLCAQLHQTPRTLRRRLDEQGLSFRELLDQTRAELEMHLQLQGESRAQIALQLGYNDQAAYLHARKRWKNALG
jgi:AraC-like DNA-binding protein